MNEYARRRKVVGDALQTPEAPILSNNELSRLLGSSVFAVRRVRRELESAGMIQRVYRRMSRRGYFIDVSRMAEAASRKAV